MLRALSITLLSSAVLFSCASAPKSPLVNVSERMTVNGIQYTKRLEVEKRAATNQRLCDLKEEFKIESDGTKYSLVNLISKTGTRAEHCPLANFADDNKSRYLIVETESDEIADMTQIAIEGDDGQYDFLPEWFDAADKLETLNKQALIDVINSFPISFENLSNIEDSQFWAKSRRSKIDGEYTNISYFNGKYRKTVDTNGDSKEQCSTDGVNWSRCS